MLRRQSYSLNEMVDRQVSIHKKVRSKLAALFIYFGTPRNKGIGSNGATEVGAGISLKIKINGLGGKIFSFRHKLPIPTN